jgi:hypothetical protein
MKKIIKMAVAAIGLLVLAGCADTPIIETLNYVETDDGYVEFSTNDSQYYDYSFWTTYDNTTGSTDFSAGAVKLSGANNYGYGVIFGFADRDNNIKLLIDTNKCFCIVKTIDGQQEVVAKWQISNKLKSGFEVENVISITQIGDEYGVFFNNSFAGSFEDSTLPKGGRFGFITTIGTKAAENFPAIPSDVKFRFMN